MKLEIEGQNYYLGKWRGFVTRLDDPQKQFRVRAVVPDVLGEVESNWALPCFEGGSDDPKLPKIGQMVWFEFESGDPNQPIWTGCTPSTFSGNLPAPLESLGEDGETVLPPRGTAETTTRSGRKVKEPVTAFVGDYGTVQSFKTKSGHHIEIDDTPDNERVAVITNSGAAVEMDNTGSLRIRVNRSEWTVTGDNIERVKGKRIEINDGPVETENRRETTHTTLGKMAAVFGDDVEVDMKGSNFSMNVDGSLFLKTGGRNNWQIGGDLNQNIIGSHQQGIMGGKQLFVTGNSEEIVGNSLGMPMGKNTVVVAGSYGVEVALGGMNLFALGPIRMGNPLAFQPLVRGFAFMALFNQLVTMINLHVHNDPLSGVTGPPTLLPFPMMTPLHVNPLVLIP